MTMNLKKLYQNQCSPEEIINENFFKVDAFSTLSVVKRIDNSHDNDIVAKSVYLVVNNDDIVLKDKINQLACYNENLGWLFFQPKKGNLMFLQSEGLFYFYSGTEWIIFTPNKDGTIGSGADSDGSGDVSLLMYNNLSDLDNIEVARRNLNVFSKEETFCKEKCLNDIPDQDLACKNIGTLRDWQIRRVGDYKVSAMKTDHDNWLLCDGRGISRTEYKELFSLIGVDCGAGNGIDTFNIPNFKNKTLWGADGNLNKTISAGLPNIIGEFETSSYPLNIGGQACSGAIEAKTKANLPSLSTTTTKTTRTNGFAFNASRSDAIYGASTTVQPPAVAVNIFILAK